MSFTATFSGGPAVLVMEGSFKLQNRVDERSRCSFTVADPTGIATYPKGSRVVVTDSVLGVLYTGFVNSAKPQNLIAQPYIYWDIDTVDMHYLADKVTSADSYVNQSAGVVVADQYLKYLQPEGVLAPVAMDTENSQAEWAEGTLASTVATGNVGDGDLELNSSTSAQDAYVTQTNWNTGTKVSVTANLGTGGVGDVALTSSSRNWDNGVKSGQSLWGNGNPSDQVVSGQYQLHCDANSQTQARLDFAGAWANFTVTCDCYLHASTFKSGFTYRTTGWVNGDSSYAYAIEMTNAGIELHVGTNGGSGGDTTLASVAFSPQLATGQMYTIKAIVSGSSHQIYVNGTLYISVTDSTYTAAGYFGLRNRNTYSSGTWRYFDNFGVVSATSGTWTSPSASINAVSTIASTIIMW